MEDFLAGGAAAVAAICLLHPLDVVKTRLQLQGEAPSTTPQAYSTLPRSLAQIARAEGPKGLYGGLAAACCLQVSVTGMRFGTYGMGKSVLGCGQDGALSVTHAFPLALIAAFLGGLAGTPFYAIKTRMQASTSATHLAVGHQHHYATLRHALTSITSSEGIRGLWRGAHVFIPRVLAYGSVQLSAYENAQSWMNGTVLQGSVKGHVVASAWAAVLAVTAMQPFDFLAARMMNQPMFEGRPAYYVGVWDCAVKSARAEGLGVFFKGATANYARMVPYTILVFVFFEQLKILGRP